MKLRITIVMIIALVGSLANAVCGGTPLGMTQQEAQIRSVAYMRGKQSLALALAKTQNIGVEGDKQASCNLIAMLLKTIEGPSCPTTETGKRLDPIRTIMRLSNDLNFSESIDLTELNTKDSNEYAYIGLRIVRSNDERVESFYNALFQAYYDSVEKTGVWNSYSFQNASVDVCQEFDKFDQ